MTSTQMFRTRNAGNTARSLNLHHALLEESLSVSSKHNRLPSGLRDIGVLPNSVHLMLLPLQQTDRWLYRSFFSRTMPPDQFARLCAQEINWS